MRYLVMACVLAMSAAAASSQTEVAAGSCELSELADRLERMAGESDAATALSMAESLCERCPASASARLALGRSLARGGEVDKAMEAAREAMALDRKSYEPLLFLAELSRGSGDGAGAEAFAASALALATTAEQKDAVERFLYPPPLERPEAVADASSEQGAAEGGYRLKSAEEIRQALQIGNKSIRPKSLHGKPSDDFFAGESGYGVNLTVLFDAGSTRIRDESQRQVEELLEALEGANAGERFLLEGHASSEGPEGFNQQLSEARARAMSDLLASRLGLTGGQLAHVGRGEAQLVVRDGSEDRERSRRVTLIRMYDE